MQFNLTLVTIKLAEAVRCRAPKYLHCDNGGLQHLERDILVAVQASIVDGLKRSVFLLRDTTRQEEQAAPDTLPSAT